VRELQRRFRKRCPACNEKLIGERVAFTVSTRCDADGKPQNAVVCLKCGHVSGLIYAAPLAATGAA
jgi:RNase P subunit RPR2